MPQFSDENGKLGHYPFKGSGAVEIPNFAAGYRKD